MEKLINEFKVIETDEGFRIEIKGDKEHMKAFMKEFSGHKNHHHWGRHRGRFGWGPYGFPHAMWMHMGPCWDSWPEEPEMDKTEVEENKA